MNLRTLSRGACAALLFTAVPAFAETPASKYYAHAVLSDFPAQGRYVLVDAASQRLFMVEDGQIQDSMKVVVGKPGSSTPMLESQIYTATLNPYWNVPVDLSQKIIAPKVLKEGLSYLKEHRYEVVSDFEPGGHPIAAESVDWDAVADGRTTVYVRQLPGGSNAMGEVKFSFPNDRGIYLHDTPDKQLFEAEQRTFSNGCVRLEDAKRLGRWLAGTELLAASDAPEQRVMLPRPVPVYIRYLNQQPATEQIASASAPAGQDWSRLASSATPTGAPLGASR